MSENYEVTPVEGGRIIKSWTKGVLFEDHAKAQLNNIAKLPFIHKHVAAMPDVHAGIGATVGSVVATKGAIVPAIVGVDLSCGMVACQTTLTASDLPESLAALRAQIEREVPHGGPGLTGAWQEPLKAIVEAPGTIDLMARYRGLIDKHPKISNKWVLNQLGTLGTGNHFVEVCLDESQNVWVMLHSGSRGPGNSIGTYFIDKAKEEMRRFFINLPDMNLAYLPEGSKYFDDYIEALSWAGDYAAFSRQIMLDHTLYSLKRVIRKEFNIVDNVIQCNHNYVQKEHHFHDDVWLTRKGAVRARKNDLGIIPGSMGQRSYIVRGLGNPEAFHSCSHGAGRAMSRTEAKNRFNVKDHIKATEGVECRKDKDVIDETPMAYKDLDKVMEAQKDLVEVVHTLKAVLCVKG